MTPSVVHKHCQPNVLESFILHPSLKPCLLGREMLESGNWSCSRISVKHIMLNCCFARWILARAWLMEEITCIFCSSIYFLLLLFILSTSFLTWYFWKLLKYYFILRDVNELLLGVTNPHLAMVAMVTNMSRMEKYLQISFQLHSISIGKTIGKKFWFTNRLTKFHLKNEHQNQASRTIPTCSHQKQHLELY